MGILVEYGQAHLESTKGVRNQLSYKLNIISKALVIEVSDVQLLSSKQAGYSETDWKQFSCRSQIVKLWHCEELNVSPPRPATSKR